ncbi:MAG: hypothetical protein ACOH2H_25455 [Cypionkella sp.]
MHRTSAVRSEDAIETLGIVLTGSGCASTKAPYKPRLLSDNGSFYIAADLAKYL